MIKKIFSTVLAAGVLMFSAPTAMASDVAPQKNRIVSSNQAPSTGHNLQRLRRAADIAGSGVDMKVLPGKERSPRMERRINVPGKGLKADVLKHRRASGALSSALMFESFESCQRFSDVMPQGWSQLSRGETPVDVMDHWIGLDKEVTDFYYMTPPADGNVLLYMGYNDYVYKDEWLFSPEVLIEDGAYNLGFYWYTIPYYMYMIDTDHVDFNNGVFTDRQILFNVQVLAKAEDSDDWTVIYDLESQFAPLEYEDICMIDYEEMQQALVDLSAFAGKKVQFAFRYFGKEGNGFLLDAVSVDLANPEVSYEPDYSRLFYGFSADEDVFWMDATIEFYPVNHPILWYNSSPDTKNFDFKWQYYTFDDGEWKTNEWTAPDYLAVTYKPDYTDASTLMNNFYYMPTLVATTDEGGIGTFTSKSDFLQAGGTPEYGLTAETHTKYTATNFDIIQEGFSLHLEGDDDLGFYLEPIFGYSGNTDAWWEHHCYPSGANGRYAYVDGFANLYLPHPTAPLVVNGVSAVGYGNINDDAEFTLNVYTMDEEGCLIETPLATQKVRGADVIKIPSGLGHDYLVINFALPKPVVFDTDGTGYGYIVEVGGYHNDNVQYFCPLQSIVPNEFEWAFGFYHLYSSFDEMYDRTLTDQFGYVCLFKDDYGRDLFTSFAIGLDAHYPWLDLADEAEGAFTFDKGATRFALRNYFDPARLTVEAPDWVEVTLSPERYLTEVEVNPLEPVTEGRSATVRFSAPGVSLAVDVPVKNIVGVEGISADGASAHADDAWYAIDGRRVLRPTLPGLYIRRGQKVLVR